MNNHSPPMSADPGGSVTVPLSWMWRWVQTLQTVDEDEDEDDRSLEPSFSV